MRSAVGPCDGAINSLFLAFSARLSCIVEYGIPNLSSLVTQTNPGPGGGGGPCEMQMRCECVQGAKVVK